MCKGVNVYFAHMLYILQVCEWFKPFNAGHKMVRIDSLPRQPLTSKTNR